MRIDEIISTQISTSISYDPEAKRLRFSGNQARLRLSDLNKIKHIRRHHAKQSKLKSQLIGIQYKNETSDHEDKPTRIDQMALNHLKRERF